MNSSSYLLYIFGPIVHVGPKIYDVSVYIYDGLHDNMRREGKIRITADVLEFLQDNSAQSCREQRKEQVLAQRRQGHSLIYWVHFLVRRFPLHAHMDTPTHTHTHPAASTRTERGKQKVWSEERIDLTLN